MPRYRINGYVGTEVSFEADAESPEAFLALANEEEMFVGCNNTVASDGDVQVVDVHSIEWGELETVD